jgi:mono/diheme cytochrome c family protein
VFTRASAAVAATVVGLAVVLGARTAAAQAAPQPGTATKPGAASTRPPNPEGWQVPDTAAAEKNPKPSTPQTIAAGKQLFTEHCRKCHGPLGKGDGPEADPDHKPADLSDPTRMAKNADGVIFYKVWNGRNKPKMPAFREKMTRDEVWTLITYVRTLSRTQGD